MNIGDSVKHKAEYADSTCRRRINVYTQGYSVVTCRKNGTTRNDTASALLITGIHSQSNGKTRFAHGR